jgi:hypothetical protein
MMDMGLKGMGTGMGTIKVVVACVSLAYALLAAAVDAHFGDPSGFLQYGALGLCTIMVILQYLDRRDLARLIQAREREKDAQIARFSDILSRFAEGLKDRKCIAGDSRFNRDN